MTLREWDKEVAPTLHQIEDHSLAVVRAVNGLPVRPSFNDSKAEAQMIEAERALDNALTRIRLARSGFACKPLES
jgi:hypothetical protein